MKKLLVALLLAVSTAAFGTGSSYYNHTTFPVTGSAATSAGMRAELDLIMAGFGFLPALGAGNANKVVVMNSGDSALTFLSTPTGCTNQFVNAVSSSLALTCATVSLTANVSGVLPTANGGTGIAYFTAAGPSTARVYTFPDANSTVVVAGVATGSGITMSTGKLLGRTTASTGAIEEISAGAGLTLSGGSLSTIGLSNWSTITADPAPSVISGRYMANTTSSAFTITLPAAPVANNVITISDYAGTFGTNNLTVGRNGAKINGIAEDMVIHTNWVTVVLQYIDATTGWRAM